ncbi:MAG: MerR family DNA-binding protein, partial [Pseudomonadota bacterium]
LILRGKSFGFSLAEIRELLNLYDLGDGQVTQLSLTLETALGKLDELKERREEITAVIGDLENQIGLVRNMLRERGESQVS